ncbi:outer membrane lipoprotein-sorting protein [Pseudoalteromonas sp. NEC-BIFX-2020_002]|uniref:outer membrane lipoprotein-sorting protein n=1 Tax=Pseudoalteromonas sp. NEC-BIFX-2020_002 TaxID=2732353 RepID=UPI001476CF74|nr:outer membrane lipoprotein-sorting protein [Pseudoalteromonas sp. NEC-BIFX-2020_002]NNG41916.1 outer membrane lipoprotein-sorting protein [Pseudoalteromonas sp. NEC-BIFX-2020_002]
MKLTHILASAGILLSVFADASANDANNILQQVRDRNDGKDYMSTVTLKTLSDDSLLNQRQFYMLQKDIDQDEVMVLAIKAPADVRDISFLMRSFDEGTAQEDEQWMYLPAFRKVRRISATDKRGAFMGSEYSYYDLDKLRVTDFDSKIVKSESVNDVETHVIERTPKSQDVINKSGYYKLVTWVDKDRKLILKQQYFDAKGILFKQLDVDKVDKIQGFWTITASTMTNFIENKKSTFLFHETLYNQGIEDAIFRKSKLKRGIKDSDVAGLIKISELE